MEKTASLNALENETLGSLLWRLSLPTMASLIINSLYNITDRIILGNVLGSSALAAVTIGFPLTILVMAFLHLIGTGATTLFSLKLGEKNLPAARQLLVNALYLLGGCAVIITIIYFFYLETMLQFLGASKTILPQAKTYFHILILGTSFQLIGIGLAGFINAEGNPLVITKAMAGGALINFLATLLLVVIFKLGILGAALGTLLAQGSVFLIIFSHWYQGKSLIKPQDCSWDFNYVLASKILATGFPPFLYQLLSVIIISFFNKTLTQYGNDSALALIGIINMVDRLISIPIWGINQASQTIIGYNYGAQKFSRAKQAFLSALKFSSLLASCGYALVMFFPGIIINFFTNQASLAPEAPQLMITFLFCLPLVGINILGITFFQAIGQPRMALLLNLTKQLLFFAPAILILPKFFGLWGLFLTVPLTDFCSACLISLIILRQLKKLTLSTTAQNSSFKTKPLLITP